MTELRLRERVLNALTRNVMVETVACVRAASLHEPRTDIVVVRERGGGDQHCPSERRAMDYVHRLPTPEEYDNTLQGKCDVGRAVAHVRDSERTLHAELLVGSPRRRPAWVCIHSIA